VLEPLTGAVHLRTISAAYAVWKVLSFAELWLGGEPRTLRMAEVGAGVGFTAFAASNLGVGSYTVYDLPEVNIVQGYFLLSTLQPSEVRLYGETGEAAPRVSVLPAFAFEKAQAKAFDVTLNVDSLPEIAPLLARRYLAHIARASRLFFSINQEAQSPQTASQNQTVTRDLVSEVPGYRVVLRYPNWIRPGYVDELWVCP